MEPIVVDGVGVVLMFDFSCTALPIVRCVGNG
jgi:hypothetical protein